MVDKSNLKDAKDMRKLYCADEAHSQFLRDNFDRKESVSEKNDGHSS